MKIFAIGLFIIMSQMIRAQENLAFYCDVMANAYEGENRNTAATKFNELFFQALNEKNSFNNPFTELKWVSIKYDEAKSFRVITWQLKNKDNNHQYFGFIQKNDGSLFKLMNKTKPNADSEYEMNDADNWMGCLYYNIREVEIKGKKNYILFGYNANNSISNYKICEVLTFDDSNKPIFGNEIFMIGEGVRPDLKSRIIIEYSAISNVNFNYNEEMGMIVHDHLIARTGVSDKEVVSRIPDGTYVGYKWDGKVWKYIDKIEHQISDPNEIFYQPKAKEVEKKDLFGKRKG